MLSTITDELTDKVVDAMRQALSGDLDTGTAARRIREAQEEAERLRRLRQCVYYDVQVAEFNRADLIIARLGRSRNR